MKKEFERLSRENLQFTSKLLWQLWWKSFIMMKILRIKGESKLIQTLFDIKNIALYTIMGYIYPANRMVGNINGNAGKNHYIPHPLHAVKRLNTFILGAIKYSSLAYLENIFILINITKIYPLYLIVLCDNENILIFGTIYY